MTNVSSTQYHATSALQSSTTVSCDAPIGLFDSGIGGLSVYLHLQNQLPNERYVYYADILHMPYGARREEDITHLTLTAVSWLANAGCKIIVIACNSASAHALDIARERYPDIPIVGLVPALKPAVLNSHTKKVAVLATQATLNGRLLNEVIETFAAPNGTQVMKWFDPALVPWVEAGMDKKNATATTLLKTLHNFARQDVDYLVLGCTHYPFFRDYLVSEVLRHNLGITIVDSGAAVASRVKDILHKHNLSASPTTQQTSALSALYIGHLNTLEVAKEHLLFSNTTQTLSDCQDLITQHNLKDHDFKVESAKMSHPSINRAKLAFLITDLQMDLASISTRVKRLLHSTVL